MTLSRVEVITSVERRRRWPRAEKERLVALALEPGASASEIARSAGVHVSQLFRWRKQLCELIDPPVPALDPVRVNAFIAPSEVEPSAAPARPHVTSCCTRERFKSGTPAVPSIIVLIVLREV